MADSETTWDADVAGPGTFTNWDTDVAGPGTLTRWDLLPSVIQPVALVVWSAAGRVVSWLPSIREVIWR